MGNLYDVRSDVEHMHEYRHLEEFDRATRIYLAKLEAVSEWISRNCLSRILLDPILVSHFGHVTCLEQFWAKAPTEQQKIWGDPIDPKSPLKGFNFDYVSDQKLGADR